MSNLIRALDRCVRDRDKYAHGIVSASIDEESQTNINITCRSGYDYSTVSIPVTEILVALINEELD